MNAREQRRLAQGFAHLDRVMFLPAVGGAKDLQPPRLCQTHGQTGGDDILRYLRALQGQKRWFKRKKAKPMRGGKGFFRAILGLGC